MEVMGKIRMWLGLFLGFLFFVLTQVSAKEPEEIWRELGSLSGAERQKQLLSGAKTEGKAVLYGNINAEQLEKHGSISKSAIRSSWKSTVHRVK